MKYEYHERLASAFVRGTWAADNSQVKLLRTELFQKPISDLTEGDMRELIQMGNNQNLPLHIFSRPVNFTLFDRLVSLLKGIQPDNVLEVGSGRGLFLWQLLENFRYLSVTAVEQENRFVNLLQAVSKGGFGNLKVTHTPYYDLKPLYLFEYDLVLGINLLDYNELYESVFAEMCKLAKRFVIVTVSKGRNDNPRLVRSFNEADLKHLFLEQKIEHIKIETLDNHYIAVGRK